MMEAPILGALYSCDPTTLVIVDAHISSRIYADLSIRPQRTVECAVRWTNATSIQWQLQSRVQRVQQTTPCRQLFDIFDSNDIKSASFLVKIVIYHFLLAQGCP